MFVRGYVPHACEYIKEQCGLGSLIGYVLSIPLQPLEDMQSFSTSSLLGINKHSPNPLKCFFFFFSFWKILNSSFQSEDGKGPHRHLLILRASRGESVWCGEERPSAPDLQVKTDGGPVKPTLGKVAALPAREVGYKYPPHTAVSSKSKHFRFCLVIYHCSLYHGGKIKAGEMLSWKIAVCTVGFYFHLCFMLSLHVAYSHLLLVSLASQSALY